MGSRKAAVPVFQTEEKRHIELDALYIQFRQISEDTQLKTETPYSSSILPASDHWTISWMNQNQNQNKNVSITTLRETELKI